MTNQRTALLFEMPRQRRLRRGKEDDLYAAARRLRRNGHRVYRAGPNHSTVNGKRMPNAQVIVLWRQLSA